MPKRLHDARDLICRERLRCSATLGEGDRPGPNAQDRLMLCLASGVCDLDCDLGAVSVHGFDDACESRDVTVVAKAE